MKLLYGTVAFAALLSPAMAAAQQADAPAPAGSERRLTPEQVEAVLAEAAAKRAATEKQAQTDQWIAEDDGPPPLPPVHGEIGVTVGSGGYREVFGTSIFPLGNDGAAAISFDFLDWGDRRFKY